MRSGEGVMYCDDVSDVTTWKASSRKSGLEPFLRERLLGIGVNASPAKMLWDGGLDFCGVRRGRCKRRIDVTSDRTKDGTDSSSVNPAYPSTRTLSKVRLVSFRW